MRARAQAKLPPQMSAEVKIPREHHAYIIGPKGERIQKLMAEFPSMADKYAEVHDLPLRGSEFLFIGDRADHLDAPGPFLQVEDHVGHVEQGQVGVTARRQPPDRLAERAQQVHEILSR